jgi:hypothetical protein
MTKDFESLPQNITMEGLNKASELIEVGLNQGKEPFVRLAQDKMRVGMDTIEAVVQKELEQPRLSKAALEAASQLVESRQTKFDSIEPPKMKEGLNAAAQIIERVKGKFTAQVTARENTKSHGRDI